MDDIFKNINKDGKKLQVNVQVITLDDNLSHPYFSLLDVSEANNHPLGVAVVEMPYEKQISDYWIKYHGVVVISFNISDYQYVNTNAEEYIKQFALKNKIINPHYNYSLICKVSRFKQKGNKFVIHFENLGWKFLQKVPKEFRQTYVANQSLDDVFQAICEFLGVQFAYSIEDLHEYNFASNGYSIEKDGETIEDVETILSRWRQTKDEPKTDEENEDSTDDTNQNNTTEQLNQNDKSIASSATNNTEQEETSDVPDTTDIQDKIDKYEEEFENKILDLFRGNTYYESNLTDPILNYDSITITPKAPPTTTSTMSTETSTDDQNNTDPNNPNANTDQNSTNTNSTTTN